MLFEFLSFEMNDMSNMNYDENAFNNFKFAPTS